MVNLVRSYDISVTCVVALKRAGRRKQSRTGDEKEKRGREREGDFEFRCRSLLLAHFAAPPPHPSLSLPSTAQCEPVNGEETKKKMVLKEERRNPFLTLPSNTPIRNAWSLLSLNSIHFETVRFLAFRDLFSFSYYRGLLRLNSE